MPRFDEISLVHIARQMLRALAHCHAAGVAHRDVRPENFMIVKAAPSAAAAAAKAALSVGAGLGATTAAAAKALPRARRSTEAVSRAMQQSTRDLPAAPVPGGQGKPGASARGGKWQTLISAGKRIGSACGGNAVAKQMMTALVAGGTIKLVDFSVAGDFEPLPEELAHRSRSQAASAAEEARKPKHKTVLGLGGGRDRSGSSSGGSLSPIAEPKSVTSRDAASRDRQASSSGDSLSSIEMAPRGGRDSPGVGEEKGEKGEPGDEDSAGLALEAGEPPLSGRRGGRGTSRPARPAVNSPSKSRYFMRTRVGTLQYMAPEMFIGSPYDHRVDAWSCGLVLYTLFCGFHPIATTLKEPPQMYGKDYRRAVTYDDEHDSDEEDRARRIIDRMRLSVRATRGDATGKLLTPRALRFPVSLSRSRRAPSSSDPATGSRARRRGCARSCRPRRAGCSAPTPRRGARPRSRCACPRCGRARARCCGRSART